MGLKLDCQFILLVAKLTMKHFSYFFHLALNFLLPFCYNLDFNNVQEAGSRILQVIKTDDVPFMIYHSIKSHTYKLYSDFCY